MKRRTYVFVVVKEYTDAGVRLVGCFSTRRKAENYAGSRLNVDVFVNRCEVD